MNALRRRYLSAMGIPAWAPRQRAAVSAARAVSVAVPGASVEGGVSAAEAVASAVEAGVPVDEAAVSVAEAGVSAAEAIASAAQRWSVLRTEVMACTQCELHRSRTQAVFGVGLQDARLMIIGEAPGGEEDRQGEPFVGPAGQLLNAMLRAIGFPRDQVYIANVLKCRPPRNRDPRPEEASACSGYLDRQIELVGPRALLAVGRISAQWLLQTDNPVGRLRGAVHRYGQRAIPLVVTYHPAYLLRTPSAKAKSWQDLCMLLPLLA